MGKVISFVVEFSFKAGILVGMLIGLVMSAGAVVIAHIVKTL